MRLWKKSYRSELGTDVTEQYRVSQCKRRLLSSERYTQDVSSRPQVSNDDHCGVGTIGVVYQRLEHKEFLIKSRENRRDRTQRTAKPIHFILLRHPVALAAWSALLLKKTELLSNLVAPLVKLQRLATLPASAEHVCMNPSCSATVPAFRRSYRSLTSFSHGLAAIAHLHESFSLR